MAGGVTKISRTIVSCSWSALGPSRLSAEPWRAGDYCFSPSGVAANQEIGVPGGARAAPGPCFGTWGQARLYRILVDVVDRLPKMAFVPHITIPTFAMPHRRAGNANLPNGIFSGAGREIGVPKIITNLSGGEFLP